MIKGQESSRLIFLFIIITSITLKTYGENSTQYLMAGYSYNQNFTNFTKDHKDLWDESEFKVKSGIAHGFWGSYVSLKKGGLGWEVSANFGQYNYDITSKTYDELSTNYTYKFSHFSISILFTESTSELFYGAGVDYMPFHAEINNEGLNIDMELPDIPFMGGHLIIGGILPINKENNINVIFECRYIFSEKDEYMGVKSDINGLQLRAGIGLKI